MPTTWDSTTKTETSWNTQSFTNASISYVPGKVGVSIVGRGRIEATEEGTTIGTQWSYEVKS